MLASETRFAVLLFTDIVGSTALKAEHGVPAYSEALRIHNNHFGRIARECRCVRILQNRGDGYFAEASSVAEAVRFALLFQQAIHREPWRGIRLATRVGIHAGEISTLVSEAGNTLVAPAIDLASRIADLAVGGQILLTRFPFDEARHYLREHPPVDGGNPPSLRWLAHGPYRFKGCPEPVEVFEVGADGLAPLVPPPDTDKARRAIRPGEEETLGWRPAAGLEIPGRPGWRLVERLGAGSFGEVWTGEHARLHQRRAFKFCFDDERLRALKREVTLIRLMRTTLGDRDDIVRLHELKLDEPPFYLESDLAPHGNLLQWAEKQGGLDQIPLEQRIGIVAHAAAALAAAHSVGVLHKDIKPTNILIFDGPDGEPRPRLVDFGIGTLADNSVLARHGITRAGFTRQTIEHSTGTPTYSPPEYLAGRPYTIQGDIYGLGVLLYQLLTAKPLDPIAPGWERDIADPLLREDIAACVDGDPARRLPSAAELAERLLSLDQRRAQIVERERLAAASQRSAYRRGVMRATAVASLVVLVVAGLALYGGLQASRARKAEQLASAERDRATSERDRARELYEFQSFLRSYELGDLREAYACLTRAYGHAASWEYGLGFGEIVARARRFVPVARFDTGSRPLAGFLWHPAPDAAPGFPAVAEAGAPPPVLVVAFDDRIRSLDLAKGDTLGEFLLPAGDRVKEMLQVASKPGCRPDSVAARLADHPLLVLSLPRLEPRSQARPFPHASLIATADAAPIVALAEGKEVGVYDLNTGAEIAKRSFDDFDSVGSIAVSSSGRVVAAAPFRVTKSKLWDWSRNVLADLRLHQSLTFVGDTTIAGAYFAQSGGEEVSLRLSETDGGRATEVIAPSAARNGSFQGRFTKTSRGGPTDSFLLAFRNEELVEFFLVEASADDSGPSLRAKVAVRAVDLAPHREEEDVPRFLDCSMDSLQLVVSCGSQVEIFAPRTTLFGSTDLGGTDPQGPRQFSQAASGACADEIACALWAARLRGNTLWAATGTGESVRISRTEFDTSGRSRTQGFAVRPPLGLREADGKAVVALEPSADQRTLFVLWESAATFTHEKVSTSEDLMIARYDLTCMDASAIRPAPPFLSPDHTFRMSAHPRGGVRVMREFFLDASEEVIIYATETKTAGYRVADGQLAYELPVCNRFVVSPDHKYLAAGAWNRRLTVGVWESHSGKLVFQTPQSGFVVAAAFAPDAPLLHVGWEQGLVTSHQFLAPDAPTMQREASSFPLLLVPPGNRMLVFKPRSGPTGDVFLTGTEGELPPTLLGPNAHILAEWQTNPEGTLIVHVGKFAARIFRRLSPTAAAEMLDAVSSNGARPALWIRSEGADRTLDREAVAGGLKAVEAALPK